MSTRLTPNMKSLCLEQGMSLIELMVSLVISAILILGVATVFLGSKRGYEVNEEIAILQENARFTLHTLTNEIRNAGFSSCGSLKGKQVNVITLTPPPGFGPSPPAPPTPGVSNFGYNTHVTGHDINGAGVASPAFDTLLGIVNIEPNTNAITIRKAVSCSARVTAVSVGVTTVTNNCNFAVGDVVIVSDCDKYDLISITDKASAGTDIALSHGGAANVQNTLSMTPSALLPDFDIRVSKVESIVYYIGRDAPAGNLGLYETRYSLVGGVVTPQRQLLVPDVEDMVITYGIDIDNDKDSQNNRTASLNAIDTATNIEAMGAADFNQLDPGETSWSRVVSVNLRLLMASQPVGTTFKNYTFNNVNVVGTDTRYRKEFITAINLRNKTP